MTRVPLKWLIVAYLCASIATAVGGVWLLKEGIRWVIAEVKK
jgi:hypothetical protein